MTQPTIGHLYGEVEATLVALQLRDGKEHTFQELLMACFPSEVFAHLRDQAADDLSVILIDLDRWGFIETIGDQDRVKLLPEALPVLERITVARENGALILDFTFEDGAHEKVVAFGY